MRCHACAHQQDDPFSFCPSCGTKASRPADPSSNPIPVAVKSGPDEGDEAVSAPDAKCCRKCNKPIPGAHAHSPGGYTFCSGCGYVPDLDPVRPTEDGRSERPGIAIQGEPKEGVWQKGSPGERVEAVSPSAAKCCRKCNKPIPPAYTYCPDCGYVPALDPARRAEELRNERLGAAFQEIEAEVRQRTEKRTPTRNYLPKETVEEAPGEAVDGRGKGVVSDDWGAHIVRLIIFFGSLIAVFLYMAIVDRNTGWLAMIAVTLLHGIPTMRKVYRKLGEGEAPSPSEADGQVARRVAPRKGKKLRNLPVIGPLLRALALVFQPSLWSLPLLSGWSLFILFWLVASCAGDLSVWNGVNGKSLVNLNGFMLGTAAIGVIPCLAYGTWWGDAANYLLHTRGLFGNPTYGDYGWLVWALPLAGVLLVGVDAKVHKLNILRHSDYKGIYKFGWLDWMLLCVMWFFVAFPFYLVERKRLIQHARNAVPATDMDEAPERPSHLRALLIYTGVVLTPFLLRALWLLLALAVR
jgi:hypothetical protein